MYGDGVNCNEAVLYVESCLPSPPGRSIRFVLPTEHTTVKQHIFVYVKKIYIVTLLLLIFSRYLEWTLSFHEAVKLLEFRIYNIIFCEMHHISRAAPFNEYVSVCFEKYILSFIETYPSVGNISVDAMNMTIYIFVHLYKIFLSFCNSFFHSLIFPL